MLVKQFALSSGCHGRVCGTLSAAVLFSLRSSARPVSDLASRTASCAAGSNSNGHPPSMNGNGTQNGCVQHGSSNGVSNSNHENALNGRNGNGTANERFLGKSVQELQDWLEAHGVDTSCYGKGLAKTVAELLEEQERAESVLSLEQGAPLRTVRVLSLHILNDKGQVLFEDEQILPDGRSRRRQVAVSEKLVGDEAWQAAVHRAVQEELEMALPQGYKVEVMEDTYRRLEEMSTSMSYPGLTTKYVFHRVSARLPGLPCEPFETYELRQGGRLTTRWVWRDLQEVITLEECQATSSTG